MRKMLLLLLLVLSATWATPLFGVETPETSHLKFVTEYIRELAAIESIRASGEKEMSAAKDEMEKFTSGIHSSTLFQLELRSQIVMLKDMRLNTPFDELIPDMTTFYQRKIELHQDLIDIGSAFLAGPERGVDYGKLAAEMPKIRAKLDYIDRALFDVSPMAFASLIEPRGDSRDHASHLIITKAERAKLIDDLNNAFGKKLDQKDPNFTVGAASVLRTYLLKSYKCSDEPWD